MKIWIDKHGGLHYHKPDCQVVQSKTPPIFPYEEITRIVRWLGTRYSRIRFMSRYYYPCPFCFGKGNVRIEKR